MSIIKSNLPILRSDEFVNADGVLVQRVVYDVPGHDVQMACHNGVTSAVVVMVDNDMAQMPLSKADGYIRSRI
jgi:hypothetical protein